MQWDFQTCFLGHKQRTISYDIMFKLSNRSANEHLDIFQFIFNYAPDVFFNAWTSSYYLPDLFWKITFNQNGRRHFFFQGVHILLSRVLFSQNLNDFYSKIISIYPDMTFEEHQQVTTYIITSSLKSPEDFWQRLDLMETFPDHPWKTPAGNTFLHQLCGSSCCLGNYVFVKHVLQNFQVLVRLKKFC